MRVNVERNSAVRVSQKLLNGFDILSVGLQQGAEGVAESMPAEVLVDASLPLQTGLM